MTAGKDGILQFIRVRNFEKFQHYTDRRPPWIKLYKDLFSDPQFFALKEKDRYLLFAIFIVASQNDNHIPLDWDWISRECLTKVTQDRIDALLKSYFIEASTEAAAKSEWASRYISKDQRLRILKRDGSLCIQCKSKKNLEIDHIVPISGGGSSEDSNLQLLCRKCNRTKHNRTTDARQMLDRSETNASPHARAESQSREESEVQRQSTEADIQILAYGEFGKARLSASEFEKLKAKLNGNFDDYVNRFDRWVAEAPNAKANGVMRKNRNAYLSISNWFDRDVKEGKISVQSLMTEEQRIAAAKAEVERIRGGR